MDEIYETLRDVCRQIAVHDPDLGLAAVAASCIDDLGLVGLLLATAEGSPYHRRLLSAYGSMIVLEAA